MVMKEIFEKNLVRADFYRLLAISCEEPTAENLQSIRGIGEDLLELGSVAGCSQELEGVLRKFVESTRQNSLDLQAEYHRLFNTQAACPSSEGNFQMVERGPVIGDVCAFYEAFHIKVMERQGPPDSLKMELGFMSFMALKTTYALEHQLEEESTIVQEAEKKFLSSHLGRWIGCFCMKLRETTQNRFYQTLANLLEQWVLEDCRQMGASPVPLQPFEMKEEGEVACSFGSQS